MSALVGLGIAEIALRIKNSDGKNYHIEMWKYSRDLKQRASNPDLGHIHLKNKTARLQNVKIRINSRGMRGPEIPEFEDNQRRIMFIGSSATLGWGIPEPDIMTSVLAKKFTVDGIRNVVVMNAGIGNYNAKRYTELFLTQNRDLKPTDIVVNYYVNDAEMLSQGGGNFLIRNSEIALTFWILANRFLSGNAEDQLLTHYKSIYDKNFKGFQEMKSSLAKLAAYGKEHNIKLYLMMMPEVHDLKNYKYDFIHKIMSALATDQGYIYVDTLQDLKSVKQTEQLWAMKGDPHPNAKAHEIFAAAIYKALRQAEAGQ